MRALIIGDVHLSDRPPSIRTDDYTDQIFAKLEFTVGVAQDRDVDCVIFAGDVFHVKAPTRTSHALVRRVAELGQSYDRPWLIVPGNHDMRHDRLDTLDRQPLGVLFRAGAIQLVGEVEHDGDRSFGGAFKVFGIPWLYDWAHDLPAYFQAWQASDAELMVTHAPIVQSGESRPYDVIDATDWDAAMGRIGSVYFGHMHETDGAFTTPEGSTFCNQGALSRGSIHEETLTRKPAVTLYDSTESYQRQFLRIEVPHLPAREVFLFDQKEIEELRTDRLDEFLAGIGETQLDKVSIEAVREHVRSLGLPPAVEREAADCLEVALHG